MYELEFTQEFNKSFSKIKDKEIRKQIYLKIQELKIRVPIGKKLTGHKIWRIRINKFRIVYEIKEKNKVVLLLTILERKRKYKEIN